MLKNLNKFKFFLFLNNIKFKNIIMFIYRFMVYILSNISIKDSVILKVEGSGSSGDS